SDLSRRFSVLVDGLNIIGEVYYPGTTAGLNPALCICHGIPASAPDPSDSGYPLLADWFARKGGFITCIFNFRGCGESEGNLDLMDWTRDLDSVITYLSWLEGVDSERISLIGFSGGAAVSAYVAARDRRVACVALCACPARFSISAIGRTPEEFIRQCRDVGTIRDENYPPSVKEWASHFQEVSPVDYVERISPRPLLIIHGDKDETIDPSHARMLYKAAREPKEMVMIPGGGHRLRTNEVAMESALRWLRRTNGVT
ncbi:MAG: alpha/beta fold hydrolase, partial [Dehalococcoidia bacterium]